MRSRLQSQSRRSGAARLLEKNLNYITRDEFVCPFQDQNLLSRMINREHLGQRTLNDMTDGELTLFELVGSLPKLVNGDASLLHRGRYLSAEIMLEVGAAPFYIAIENGRIAKCDRRPLLMRSCSFAVRSNEHAWRQFWLKFPPPHFHDLFALTKRGEFRIDGDFRLLMTHLLYFKGMLAAPRQLAKE